MNNFIVRVCSSNNFWQYPIKVSGCLMYKYNCYGGIDAEKKNMDTSEVISPELDEVW